MATLPKAPPTPASTRPRPRSLLKASGGAERSLTASTAKTHLLALLDEVDEKRSPVIITKRGRPVARLVPIVEAAPASIFGCMKGTFKITGDIVGPEPDVWEAME